VKRTPYEVAVRELDGGTLRVTVYGPYAPVDAHYLTHPADVHALEACYADRGLAWEDRRAVLATLRTVYRA